jgi:lipopolysaccharide transport system ATP-binding protein
MSAHAIRVSGLGKKYWRGPDAEARLIARFRKRSTGETIWALRNCSFDLPKGEILGIIGVNGAGKSTLLKILSRITRPNEGSAELYGRIGALLEVGTGFHPELTGRENVFLNGALVGMRKSEIKRKFESIVEFAGVAEWIDTPIKRYSNGMKVRLAFAVAAHLEQEIMVIDEVLAVGDAAFRRKCFQTIQESTRQGRTVILVSHELPSIATTCTRAIWLEHGGIRQEGTASDVIDSYLDAVVGDDGTHRGFIPLEAGEVSPLIPRLKHIRLLDGDYKQVPCFATGDPAKFAVGYDGGDSAAVKKTSVNMTIFNARGIPLTMCASATAAESISGDPPNPGEFVCAIDKLPLVPGQYSIEICSMAGNTEHQRITGAGQFQVVLGGEALTQAIPPPGCGDVVVEQSWSLRPTS